MSDQTAAVLVLCSAPDKAVARLLSQHLLDARAAACVSVIPGMHSMYHWNDAIQAADEVLMLIKTSSERLTELKAIVKEIHPYEVPELLVLGVADALPAFLQWVGSVTAKSAA